MRLSSAGKLFLHHDRSKNLCVAFISLEFRIAISIDGRIGQLSFKQSGNIEMGAGEKRPCRNDDHCGTEECRWIAIYKVPESCSAFFMPAQLMRVDSSWVAAPCQCVSRLTAP